MAKFEIGQRVRVKPGSLEAHTVGFRAGRVLQRLDTIVGVEFDSAFSEGHDCNGAGKDGHCWYVHPDNLELLSTDPSPGGTFDIGEKVTITEDGEFEGETGVVEAVDGAGYRVVFPDESWGWFDADDFRLATSDEIEDAYSDDHCPCAGAGGLTDNRVEFTFTVKVPPAVLLDLFR